jgi:sterol desaturase/sphingolipid hydroxylase (fatty acid hydroxylase superfamily)
MPLIFLGFHPLDFLAVGLLNLFYQYWIHTETIGTMGWFEHIFMTPSHHRVHHGTNSQYLDRNHGGLLIVWDKMFGTFEPEDEKVVYGITSNINSYNLLRIAFHEWVGLFQDVRGAKTLRTGLQYIFKPPGWTPQETPASRIPAQ